MTEKTTTVEFTEREREAVVRIIGKLASIGRLNQWTVIDGERVDALESATEKLKVLE